MFVKYFNISKKLLNPKSLCKGFFLYIKRLSIFLFANTHNNNIKQKKDVTFMGTTKKISKTSISGLTPAKKKLLEKLKGTVTCSIDSNKVREELKYEKEEKIKLFKKISYYF